MLASIKRINRFTEGMSVQEFLSDEVMQYAIIKNFEIIGEAAYHLPAEFRQHYPEIEWKKIMSFRHILVHDYYNINLEIVWNAKENKLGSLKKQINSILDEEE